MASFKILEVYDQDVIIPDMDQRDTSEDAGKVLAEIYRRMPVATKVGRLFDAYQVGKMLSMAGLRNLHPRFTEKEIWYCWAKQRLGEELFNDAYGDRFEVKQLFEKVVSGQ